ncbi:uncharacterized protein [Acropora muricata]|uniref:uncharacterized protein n=1 Tax=Acropora muricata TaxID=159855 RepID=UPI0034E46F22
MAENEGNVKVGVCEDDVGLEYSETTQSIPPNIAKADEESNQESQTEEPQVTSDNGRESNGCVAVICAESSSQSFSLGGDPQPQPVATDTYTCRHRFQRRVAETNICQHSVQTPYPGFSVLIFMFVKWISERREEFKVFLIPNSNQQLMEEICQQESESYKDRRVSFLLDNTEMRDFVTLFLGSHQRIKVSFQMENQQQENFVGRELGCKQFDGLQIRSQSESRLPSRGAKATFLIQYRGREGVPCQVQGKIKLTVESLQDNGPANHMNLLFCISN